MPMPQEYFNAARDFDAFLADAMQALDLQTRHQTWQVLLAVFTAFRDRLEPRDGLIFANALPPVLRAAFIDGWDPSVPAKPFGTREDQIADVLAFRPHHSLATARSIDQVAPVLARHAGEAALDAAFRRLPEGARAFWTPG